MKRLYLNKPGQPDRKGSAFELTRRKIPNDEVMGYTKRIEKFSELCLPETFSISQSKKKKKWKNSITTYESCGLCISNR